jgi:hypothetical protein
VSVALEEVSEGSTGERSGVVLKDPGIECATGVGKSRRERDEVIEGLEAVAAEELVGFLANLPVASLSGLLIEGVADGNQGTEDQDRGTRD